MFTNYSLGLSALVTLAAYFCFVATNRFVYDHNSDHQLVFVLISTTMLFAAALIFDTIRSRSTLDKTPADFLLANGLTNQVKFAA